MTYEEKVRWMQRYQESLHREKELIEEIEQLRTRTYAVTSCLTGMPGTSKDRQIIPRAIEEILKEQKQLKKQIATGTLIRKEILAAIENISNSRSQEVLRRRYILGQKFKDIAAYMILDYRWVRKIHKLSIESLNIRPI